MINDYNLILLRVHFESEVMARELLLEAKDLSKEEQEVRRGLLNKRLAERKNLYIDCC